MVPARFLIHWFFVNRGGGPGEIGRVHTIALQMNRDFVRSRVKCIERYSGWVGGEFRGKKWWPMDLFCNKSAGSFPSSR